MLRMVCSSVGLFFERFGMFVQVAGIQHGRCVEVLGVHHLRYALQRRNDHGLFPILQIAELAGELVLQRRRRVFECFDGFVRQIGVNLALVFFGTFAVNELSILQTIENGRNRRLAQTHVAGDVSDSQFALVANGLQQQYLRRGQSGRFG